MKQEHGYFIFVVFGSPPAWGRGLKQNDSGHWSGIRAVAPRVGAWIETGLKRLIVRDI